MNPLAFLILAASTISDATPPSAPLQPIAMTQLPSIGTASPHYYQIIVERRIIIRVPAQRSPLTNFSADRSSESRSTEMPVVWKETKAPKCLAMDNIMGMRSVQRDSIDLMTRQNQRLRVQFNRGCRALDFYSGFYMLKSKDGRLCVDRDSIHARSGAKCEIDKFRKLVPVREKK